MPVVGRTGIQTQTDDGAGQSWLRHAQLAFLGFFFVRFLFPPIQWWEYLANGLGRAVFLKPPSIRPGCGSRRRWRHCS